MPNWKKFRLKKCRYTSERKIKKINTRLAGSIGRFTAMSLCGATQPSHRMSYFYELNAKVLTFIKFLIPTDFGKKTNFRPLIARDN